ncbi:PREDICTED: peroxidasin homolog [Priapulus caudatus]|uniref:Peroxidasin homolog n=1 Tax=Priapulus caudatus TaxID=37621 RepID=A0ABM1ECC4_PRICU|nr:PREDICTED: peroxidasin homolog [Priapulus caudatus]
MRVRCDLCCVVLLLLLPLLARACPDRCLCFSTTVRCMFLQFDEIPDDVPDSTTILDLRFNKITEIRPRTFRNLHNLNTLLLNNNNIRRLVDGAFEGLRNVKYIYLYKNEIQSIDRRAFQGLHNLEQLYLHFNEINHLDAETFSNLPKLERLFLQNNKLRALPRGSFSNLPSLHRLRLDGNELVCDCNVVWLAEMLREGPVNTQAAATCSHPESLRGRSLTSLQENELSCDQSNSITNYVKPQFVSHPRDQDIQFGATVYLECRATGVPDPQIIWLHNSVEIDPSNLNEFSRFRINDDGTLMIQHAQDSDQGLYGCTASNSAGYVRSDTAEVRYVNGPARPTIVRLPDHQETRVGETVSLECVADGSPRPQIVWTKDSAALPNLDKYRVDQQTGTLEIRFVRPEDHGLYRCSATNEYGSVSASAHVRVFSPPLLVEEPENAQHLQGEIGEFRCLAEGYPTPAISWFFNGNPIREDNPRYDFISGGTTLRLALLTLGDTGSYECNALNNLGNMRASARLIVRPKLRPEFIITPNDVSTRPLADVTLPCAARGVPQPNVRWLMGEHLLRVGEKYRMSPEGYLTIMNVSKADEGHYFCAAENTEGYAVDDAWLTITDTGSRFAGDNFVINSVEEAVATVDRAINNTLRYVFDTTQRRSPHDLLRLARFPTSGALRLGRAAEIFERTLAMIESQVSNGAQFTLNGSEFTYEQLVSPSTLNLIANLSGCTAHQRVANCSDMCFHKKYRSFDGICNNLQHSMWGASLTAFTRLLPPVYENGFNTPIGWDLNKRVSGFQKPAARTVSSRIAGTRAVTADEDFTHMLMTWGQFLDHDIDLAAGAVSREAFTSGELCEDICRNEPPCFPIMVPRDDSRTHHQGHCMEFVRSSAVCGSGMSSIFFNAVTPREQINMLTSFIDASNVYGSQRALADELRDVTGERGLLRMGDTLDSGRAYLPFNARFPVDCQRDEHASNIPCFLAGDFRANENVALTTMHTIWAREHNRIATSLLALNPHWDGDALYHESRKIVGAMVQHITYSRWLPKVLGERGMATLGAYTGYDPSVNPSIANVFATAAFRFGHGLVNPIMYRLNSSFQPIAEGNLPLHKAFFSPHRLVDEGGVDPLLRGLFGVAAKLFQPDQMMNTELIDRLFEMVHEVALDLGALNVQRGRDHGLPSYNAWREYCGLAPARTFHELRREISSREVINKLQTVYGHPDNIDVFIGGMSEDKVEGARMGPTFMCIIADQFKRLRDGDRFWYENPGVFSPGQLTAIKQASLARVICDNSESIDRVQKDVFVNVEYPQGYESCSTDIPHVDLSLWVECCQDCSTLGASESFVDHLGRSKRSEFSYPEDRPQRDQTQQLHGAPIALIVDTEAQEHMDIMEDRIEGLETLVETMTKTLYKFNRKMRKMEAHMSGKNCVDADKQQRNNGEAWMEGNCSKCICKKFMKHCKEVC